MKSGIMLNVGILSVVMLNAVAPFRRSNGFSSGRGQIERLPFGGLGLVERSPRFPGMDDASKKNGRPIKTGRGCSRNHPQNYIGELLLHNGSGTIVRALDFNMKQSELCRVQISPPKCVIFGA